MIERDNDTPEDEGQRTDGEPAGEASPEEIEQDPSHEPPEPGLKDLKGG